MPPLCTYKCRYTDDKWQVSGSEGSEGSQDEVEDLPSFIDDTEWETREDQLHRVRDLRRRRLQDDASE